MNWKLKETMKRELLYLSDISRLLKGDEVIQTQNVDVYSVNEIIIQTSNFPNKWINKLFSEENKVPRTLFEARKLAGSAIYKQSKRVWINRQTHGHDFSDEKKSWFI